MQKHKIYPANEESGLSFLSKDLGQTSDSKVGNDFAAMFWWKRPYKPEIASDFVRIHSLMIYMDLIAYNIVGDTKVPVLRLLFFISELKVETF